MKSQAEISLVRIGMGSSQNRTMEAQVAIENADLLIGARRMIEACKKPGQDCYVEYNSEKIASYIAEHPEYEKIAVVLSGDPGFQSGAKKLLDILGEQVKVLAGTSSVSYFMSKIHKSWDDVYLTSVHGKEKNLVGMIQRHKKVFAILGTREGIGNLAKDLVNWGLGDIMLYTCLLYTSKNSEERKESIWQTNIFGKSIEELVEDGIHTKLVQIGEESQVKLQDTMQKIVNDSKGGMVCIII